MKGGGDGTIVNVSVPTLLGSGAELSNHAALLYPAEEKVLMFSNDCCAPIWWLLTKASSRAFHPIWKLQ